jgi:tetratricopeptide (TPR) repeat protein
VEQRLLSLESLEQLLPELEELEELRLAASAAALPDPQRGWDRSAFAATLDKRILSVDALLHTLDEGEASAHAYASTLYGYLRAITQARGSGSEPGVLRALIEMGDWLEGTGRLEKARRCFRTALARALPLADKTDQVVALRRIARIARALGEFDEAVLHYRRSAELAEATGDLREWAIAATGHANVLVVQGRWHDAEQQYREALARIEPEEALATERAHIFTNLGLVATRQLRFDEAERWFEHALALWQRDGSSADLAVCLLNLALLQRRQGRSTEARATLEAAAQSIGASWQRAMVLIETADLCLEQGRLDEAVRWGREAEQQALRGRSPFYLAIVYRGLGKIVWGTGDETSVAFFEKSLEIARKKGYLLVEGETLLEYARLRSETGQEEEAAAYLERAREIFHEIGALHEVERAEEALDALRAQVAELAS